MSQHGIMGGLPPVSQKMLIYAEIMVLGLKGKLNRKASFSREISGGRYWARTSDPRFVRPVLFSDIRFVSGVIFYITLFFPISPSAFSSNKPSHKPNLDIFLHRSPLPLATSELSFLELGEVLMSL